MLARIIGLLKFFSNSFPYFLLQLLKIALVSDFATLKLLFEHPALYGSFFAYKQIEIQGDVLDIFSFNIVPKFHFIKTYPHSWGCGLGLFVYNINVIRG